jgi:predicted ATPase with chaperone activity
MVFGLFMLVKFFGCKITALSRMIVILKVACTIADLDGSSAIQVVDIYETISYRSLDRNTQA